MARTRSNKLPACFHKSAALSNLHRAAQEELLAAHFRTAWLLFDGDEAGSNAGPDCAVRLVKTMFIGVSELPSGQHPDQMQQEEVAALLR